MKYAIGVCYVFICCVFLLTDIVRAEEEYPLRDLVECSPRSGLPNFFAKLKAGKKVKIAYFGGSITAQNGWRVLSREWFQKEYPEAKISEINAAIGGTGSDLGVFRLKNDVLDKKPDLIFIEFSVNDAKRAPEQIEKAMEGMVRQTWRQIPDCDICYVYTFKESLVDTQLAGKMWYSASVMEDVADHYGIPSIHMGVEATQMIRDGKLEMRSGATEMTKVSGDSLNESSALPVNEDGKIAFAKDGVHPYLNTGHVLYLKSIIRSVPKIMGCGQVGPHSLVTPIDPGNWEHAKMVLFEKDMLDGNWEKMEPAESSFARLFSKQIPAVWKATPGSTLKFKFKGTYLGFYDLLGPGCGLIDVKVDGISRELRRIDGYCIYYRLATCTYSDNLEDKLHEVEVKVLDKKIDKEQVLFERNRYFIRNNPEKYENNDWYAGAIFIIGDIQ